MGALVAGGGLSGQLMQATFGDRPLALPFGRRIDCLDCHVAGTGHHAPKDLEGTLSPGAALALRRQPSNEHDPLAVEVLWSDARIGYLPRDAREVVARLMDAGKSFSARVVSLARRGGWLEIRVTVSLDEPGG